MTVDQHEDRWPAGTNGQDASVPRLVTPPGDAPRVLIIEDDEAVRTVLGRALAHAGFAPVLAASAAAAEDIISDSIAAMVVDFHLRGSRGDLFFYFASSRFPMLRRRTVFLTGDTSDEVEQMVAYTGCPLRHKPFINGSLIALLKSIVESSTGR